MNTLRDLFRIGLIVLVISAFLIPLHIKQTTHNLQGLKSTGTKS